MLVTSARRPGATGHSSTTQHTETRQCRRGRQRQPQRPQQDARQYRQRRGVVVGQGLAGFALLRDACARTTPISVSEARA